MLRFHEYHLFIINNSYIYIHYAGESIMFIAHKYW